MDLCRRRRHDAASIAVSHDGARLYVTHFLTGSVSVIDAATSAVITTFTGSPGLYGIAVSPDRTRLYIAHFGSGDLISIIDTASATQVGEFHGGSGPVRAWRSVRTAAG